MILELRFIEQQSRLTLVAIKRLVGKMHLYAIWLNNKVRPNSREDRNIEKKKNLRIWGPGQEFRNLPQFLALTTRNQGQEFRNCAN